jgi:hypothetical protein
MSGMTVTVTGIFSGVYFTYTGVSANPASGTNVSGVNSVSQAYTNMAASTSYGFTAAPVNVLGYISNNTAGGNNSTSNKNFTINSATNFQGTDISANTSSGGIYYAVYIFKSNSGTTPAVASYVLNYTAVTSGKIHVFAVGGGGGGGTGGGAGGSWYMGGGGGGGGVVMQTITVPSGSDNITITVGKGGNAATNGNNTTVNFTTNTGLNVTALGGGRGGWPGNTGGNGGSGGGGGMQYLGGTTNGATYYGPGTSTPTSGNLGNNGGYPVGHNGTVTNFGTGANGGGGGGAGTAAYMLDTTNQAISPASNGGNGGDGVTYSSLPGVNSYTPYLGYYWGGGGGGASVSKASGKGGLGGGGQGGYGGGSLGGQSDISGVTVINYPTASTIDTNRARGWSGGVNSGGGGGGNQDSGGGGIGGSGIVIIAFRL